MDVEIYINDQTNIVKEYLENTFKISVTELPNIDAFLEILLKNILSLKTWKNELEQNNHTINNIIFKDSTVYIEETVSNLNQALILGIIGFRIPSCMMMRRSLENLISFLYYKDHPVEYFKKELGNPSTNIKNLQNYLMEYPFELIYRNTYENKFKYIRELIENLIEEWNRVYKELSNYVHGSRKKYIELKTYIEDIIPRDEVLQSIIPLAEKTGDIINGLLITFFFEVYMSMDETKKSLIRLSIKNDLIKKYILKAFGDL